MRNVTSGYSEHFFKTKDVYLDDDNSAIVTKDLSRMICAKLSGYDIPLCFHDTPLVEKNRLLNL